MARFLVFYLPVILFRKVIMHSVSKICWISFLLSIYGCIAHIAWGLQDSASLQRSRAKVLNVGEELTREILPLQMGQSLYELYGLKASRWYEVKISYPASIPARFSIEIVKNNSTKGFNWARRLLNTEKLIFKEDNIFPEISGYGRTFALVSVQPEGIVAKSHLREQQFIIFNIVCDELIYGIPSQAWWVGFLVVFGIVIVCFIPSFLPPELLPGKSRKESMKRIS